MNPPQGHGGQSVLPQSHFDVLMSAIAASGQQLQQQQQQQQQQHYVSSGQTQVAGMNTSISSLMQNTPSGPPTDTAISLDQMFGHSGFSRAISLAQSTPSNQLNTPFYEILLQNLLQQQQQQQHQNPSQPDLATAHIQQTRSGRISRPPVPPPLAQNELMRALQMLSQPGMEPVRAAMESAGLFQGMGQSQVNVTEAEKRDHQAINQAMQMYAAAQNEAIESGQGFTSASNVASTNGYSTNSTSRPQNGADSLPKGTKRPRKQEQSSSTQKQNTHNTSRHTQPAPYVPDNWPAPPRGKGSRSAMSKEEITSRRKERNKASALASRMKKANEVEDVKDALARKEAEAEELARKCERLERELETLKQLVLSHGLSLPTPAPLSQGPMPSADTHVDPALREGQITDPHKAMTQDLRFQSDSNGNASVSISTVPSTTQAPSPFPFNFPFTASFPTSQPDFPSSTSATLAPDLNTQTDPAQTQFTFNPFPDAFTFPGTSSTLDTGAEPMLDFNMFMNMDNMLDDEADGDFEPETSPHHGSDTDADGDEGEGDDDLTPKGKRTKKKEKDDDDLVDRNAQDGDTPLYEGEMGDEDFIDPEMEDEDLFLPIEDVPIPPDTFQSNSNVTASASHQSASDTNGDVTGAMMKALKVDTRDQLAAVMQKLVDSAGEGGVGVGEEILGKLRNVIMMAQNQAGKG